jgi:hypothetical protein
VLAPDFHQSLQALTNNCEITQFVQPLDKARLWKRKNKRFCKLKKVVEIWKVNVV